MQDKRTRQILPNVNDFKAFWKEKGPFEYALTSQDYPPVLLAPEEWIFGNDIVGLLKELMMFDQKKMAFVQAPFNPKNKGILRPENIISWKINNFPEQWNEIVCEAFVPEGHLTQAVADEIVSADGHGILEQANREPGKKDEKKQVENAFFRLLEKDIENMGYILLKPGKNSKSASINKYLKEWEEDEQDAGLF